MPHYSNYTVLDALFGKHRRYYKRIFGFYIRWPRKFYEGR